MFAVDNFESLESEDLCLSWTFVSVIPWLNVGSALSYLVDVFEQEVLLPLIWLQVFTTGTSIVLLPWVFNSLYRFVQRLFDLWNLIMNNFVCCWSFSKAKPCRLYCVICFNSAICVASAIEVVVCQTRSATRSFAPWKRDVLTFKHVLVVEQLLLKVALSFHCLYLPIIEGVDFIDSDFFKVFLLVCEVIILLILHVFKFIFPRAS